MKLYGRSDIGKKRSKNEDCFVTGELLNEVFYTVVCDGMGGAAAGDKASFFACEMVKTLLEKMYRTGLNDSSLKNMLVSIVLAVNAKVFEKSESDPSLAGMGTTLVLVLVRKDSAHIIHVGDSRAYLIREGEINKLTKDHSVVQSMIDSGELTDAQAHRHPQRNYITRAIGIDRNLKVDYNNIVLHREDKILVCTDGFTEYFDDKDIYSLVQNEDRDIVKTVDRIIDKTIEAGGADNITAVLMEYDGE
ncbi:MAG: Stp1/IreP family PP2C-type Ser/Thr phosphatase [Clostridia bacterium]|nr:Stp1/IreP family PP2C-type Ser/Thr phosphatase [Clostridia bacterium]MBR6702805.1 Stp1/IreP family PP2C-type Ser/Thr phosphatase [Clostridia bacterium]